LTQWGTHTHTHAHTRAKLTQRYFNCHDGLEEQRRVKALGADVCKRRAQRRDRRLHRHAARDDVYGDVKKQRDVAQEQRALARRRRRHVVLQRRERVEHGVRAPVGARRVPAHQDFGDAGGWPGARARLLQQQRNPEHTRA
jgi:hypothetical protein